MHHHFLRSMVDFYRSGIGGAGIFVVFVIVVLVLFFAKRPPSGKRKGEREALLRYIEKRPPVKQQPQQPALQEPEQPVMDTAEFSREWRKGFGPQ
jgi:hypothetical protein